VIAIQKFRKNEYFKTVVAIALIVAIAAGFFFGLQFALGTSVPLRVVESGSMCVPYDGLCNGWSHPFDQTLHVGDIIIIQAVNPADLNANYPNSDIIVYKNPSGVTPIVHRIVEKQQIDGVWYFKTKGDGNGPILWPDAPYRYDNIPDSRGVPESLVEGKVIMRIPYFGWVTLFMRNNSWGVPLVVALILLLIVVEFVIPIVKGKRKTAQQKPAQQPL
jgi:signal peptidase I